MHRAERVPRGRRRQHVDDGPHGGVAAVHQPLDGVHARHHGRGAESPPLVFALGERALSEAPLVRGQQRRRPQTQPVGPDGGARPPALNQFRQRLHRQRPVQTQDGHVGRRGIMMRPVAPQPIGRNRPQCTECTQRPGQGVGVPSAHLSQSPRLRARGVLKRQTPWIGASTTRSAPPGRRAASCDNKGLGEEIEKWRTMAQRKARRPSDTCCAFPPWTSTAPTPTRPREPQRERRPCGSADRPRRCPVAVAGRGHRLRAGGAAPHGLWGQDDDNQHGPAATAVPGGPPEPAHPGFSCESLSHAKTCRPASS